MKYDVSASIVLYKNFPKLVLRAINSFLNTNLNVILYLVDNSPDNELKKIVSDERIVYIHNKKNTGFGAAHNIAMKEILDKSSYHLVLNPDIYFHTGVIENLYEFMNKNEDVGLVMPKVLYPDGRMQYLCKMLPTPFNVFARRFLPFKDYLKKINDIYELQFTGYNKIMNVPYLSGCFMFLRVKVLKEIGLFDEKFFMYFEDTDLTRRVNRKYKTLFYPLVSVYHEYGKESYKSLKLLFIHAVAAIRYFNKYGWFFDKEREVINKKLLEEYEKK